MFSYFDNFFSDPIGMFTMLLLALPGRLLAISAHEAAHAWMANKCGDPTAKNMGRLTLNPLKHLDILGTVMMVLIGFGWAKPVPVNPNNFRKYRRDDLLVSIAGITVNLLFFLLGSLIMYTVVGFALNKAAAMDFGSDYYITMYAGESSFIYNNSYIPMSQLFSLAPYLGDYVIYTVFGQIAAWLYQMLMYFSLTNLVLAVFNLIPVPPLDGYHVVNDIFIRNQLFASPNVARISTGVLFLLMLTGAISTAIGWVQTGAFNILGSLAKAIIESLGVI